MRFWGDSSVKSSHWPFIVTTDLIDHSTIFKKGEKWVQASRGSQVDGTKTEVTWTITITDNGKTHNWQGTLIVGGEAKSEQVDVWHRVSK
jgi:hypothetical protein